MHHVSSKQASVIKEPFYFIGIGNKGFICTDDFLIG
ncbi:MAG: hypothetical protein BWY08_01251 [Bacteroidetes bacterium ADurb.Bin174]|nr:MAG: hypothetical protein BWY08_01251 [Bacteroidetes bacterium ADurb.Bin174]